MLSLWESKACQPASHPLLHLLLLLHTTHATTCSAHCHSALTPQPTVPPRHGRLRITLRPLMAILPLIGSLQVSLTEIPRFSFDLTAWVQTRNSPGVECQAIGRVQLWEHAAVWPRLWASCCFQLPITPCSLPQGTCQPWGTRSLGTLRDLWTDTDTRGGRACGQIPRAPMQMRTDTKVSRAVICHRFGGDLSVLPGLEVWLHGLVKDSLLLPYVLPEK